MNGTWSKKPEIIDKYIDANDWLRMQIELVDKRKIIVIDPLQTTRYARQFRSFNSMCVH